MKCAVFVTHRQYSEPGPCENRRDLRKIELDGRTVTACSPHRAMAGRGQHLTLIRGR